ncbi:MAG: hypothetical protein J5507_03650 [Clostridia bacterium]|nr:hypothetical protein [Clostridia bacterium]
MKNMTKEKGITLIALIITIIVMLILVAVTINVALNGGIFKKAEDATQKTSREVAREQIIAAMIGAYDNNGNFVKENVELPEETKWCTKEETYSNASGEGNYVVTKSNEKFYVSPTDGTVLDEEPQEEPIEVDDLIPTEAETLTFDEGIFAAVYSQTEDTFLAYDDEIVELMISGTSYIWLCTNDSADALSSQEGKTLQAKKWYNYSDFTLYGPEECPIKDGTFDTAYSQSYLNRVINSFN